MVIVELEELAGDEPIIIMVLDVASGMPKVVGSSIVALGLVVVTVVFVVFTVEAGIKVVGMVTDCGTTWIVCAGVTYVLRVMYSSALAGKTEATLAAAASIMEILRLLLIFLNLMLCGDADVVRSNTVPNCSNNVSK